MWNGWMEGKLTGWRDDWQMDIRSWQQHKLGFQLSIRMNGKGDGQRSDYGHNEDGGELECGPNLRSQ